MGMPKRIGFTPFIDDMVYQHVFVPNPTKRISKNIVHKFMETHKELFNAPMTPHMAKSCLNRLHEDGKIELVGKSSGAHVYSMPKPKPIPVIPPEAMALPGLTVVNNSVGDSPHSLEAQLGYYSVRLLLSLAKELGVTSEVAEEAAMFLHNEFGDHA